jgi:hypothetical protein
MDQVLTSKLVERQLPEFVRDEYPIFVTFLQKYYEWLETNNQVNYELDALKNSIDLDKADNDYLNLIKRDLMPYFPENILADKRLFLKLITTFYKSNGTPDSVKFLFRALYNENIDIYYPKDDILKASDGKWVLPLALRIDTSDNNIFNIEKTKITGRISKATAIVEKVIESVDRQLGIKYIELYVSNIQRLFETGVLLISFRSGLKFLIYSLYISVFELFILLRVFIISLGSVFILLFSVLILLFSIFRSKKLVNSIRLFSICIFL